MQQGGQGNFLVGEYGVVVFPHVWCQVLHGKATNEGFLDGDGRSLTHKMSVWELVGTLLAITCVPNIV